MDINPWYISGFVDGEGSFLVSFSKRSKMGLGIEVRPSFTVSQHARNKEVVCELQRYFQCGSVRFNSRDQTYKYEVRSLNDLVYRILPHFGSHPLRTSKQRDVDMLRHVCHLMISKQHLTRNGIERIIEFSYSMNNLGARRYIKEDLLRMVRR